MQTKIKKAIATMAKCRAKNGFYASADRYKYEYWTRDLYYSFDAIKDLGLLSSVKMQLLKLWKNQQINGELPKSMIDLRFKWFSYKVIRKFETHKIILTLKAFRTIETRLSHWTIDSTPLGVMLTYLYADAAKEKQFLEVLKPKIKKALKFIESNTFDYLLRGGDWRDSMPEFKDKFLLSNNVMMYNLYKRLGMIEKALIIKERINAEFWNGDYYIDYLGGENFDSLGTSMVVLTGIAPKNRYSKIADKLLSASTKYGIKNVLEMQPMTEAEKLVIQSCNQRDAIWPFVDIYAIKALKVLGRQNAAQKEFNKLSALPGFYEWYEPENGRHHGSGDQLWSAASYYSAAKYLYPKI